MKPTLALISILLLAGCTSQLPEGPQAPPKWAHAPRQGAGISEDWWNDFGDPHLNSLVQRAWKNNPDIEVALQQINTSRADRFEALAAFFPTANLQLGFREAREQNRQTGFKPDDMKPWTANGGISWEIDITGKRRSLLRAAKAHEAEAWAAWKGSRLMIATEVCAARLEQSLYTGELSGQRQQLASEVDATGHSEELLERGLIDSGTHSSRVGMMEMRRRYITELERLSENARLRLQRLVGGGELPKPYTGTPRIPATPTRIPAEVWKSRPDLIAAEAAVRKAFAISDSAKLNLLPTLSLQAGGSVASSSPRDSFEVWTTSVGPKLDIPIWDPKRIADVQRSKAAATKASAQFRSVSDKAVEEIESSYNNLKRYESQLASLERESNAKRKAWQDAEAKFKSGLISSIDHTDRGRAYAESAAATTRMRLMTLNAKLQLIRALGG